jgi:hypothetical protein
MKNLFGSMNFMGKKKGTPFITITNSDRNSSERDMESGAKGAREDDR